MAILGRFRSVISSIPRGKVMTYGQVAAAAGFAGAARVTVRALQDAAELPWHRVVAAGGRIALLGQDGAEQCLRLRIEKVTFRGAKVRMDRHNWVPRGAALRRGRPTRAQSKGAPRKGGGAPSVLSRLRAK